jgi:putative DNA primase/helicase
MPEPVKIPDELKKLGEPASMWVYRTGDGNAFGAVARWNPDNGRKIVRPIVWTGEKFVTAGFGKGRPLYNTELLAATPPATALLVEGEKSADGAQRFLPEGWIVTTWQGGSKAWANTDWSIMQGRTVVIWPDNDEPGIVAADEIRMHLSSMGVPSAIVQVPPAFPDGWDLGDELPASVKSDIIGKMMKKALKTAGIVDQATPLPEIEKKEFDADPDLSPRKQYRAIGYDKQKYYIMTEDAEQIYEYTSARIMSETGLMEIIPDREVWADHPANKSKKSISWVDIGAAIMRECMQAGVYDPTRLRGRGLWTDKNFKGEERTVLNSGSTLMYSKNGDASAQVPYVQFKSRWYYEKGRDLIPSDEGATDFIEEATDADGYMIRELCDLVRWERPIDGQLLAGWIATAIICGALPWRTHAWVTGNQGSGKTTVINEIAGACIGSVGIYPMGATTEAGIRQAVGNDALPVIFDESEGQKGIEERRQAVIQLMRQSSSEGRGRIMKGTASHSAVAFTMRSSFLMSSIGVGLKEAADLTRTVVLTIKPLEAFTATERVGLEEQWQKFLSTASSMRKDMPQRLLARQMKNLPTLKHNIEVFKEVIATNLGNRRLGDQLGTLLAGAYSLISTRKITTATCEKYLSGYDWSEFTQVKSLREDIELLHHIVGYMKPVDTAFGRQDRVIGELIRAFLYPGSDSAISKDRAADLLARYGMKFERDESGIWVGTGISEMNKIMATSVYSEGWPKVLARHPLAQRSDNAIRFLAQTSRAVFIPITEWPIGGV